MRLVNARSDLGPDTSKLLKNNDKNVQKPIPNGKSGSRHLTVARVFQKLVEGVKHPWNQGRGSATIGLLNGRLVYRQVSGENGCRCG